MEKQRRTIQAAAAAAGAAALVLVSAVCAKGDGPPAAAPKGERPKAGTAQVSAELPAYAKGEDVSGNLSAVGSDTMNNIMANWAEGFARFHPAVRIQVEGKGSSTAPPALIEGTAQLGPMSRDMKATEIDTFEARFGYKPTRLRTCLDALAVFVHRDNPLESLTMQQLDAVFSSTRKRGGKPVATWGDLGLTGDWAAPPINLYGRNSVSGTYGYFKEHALDKGDFKDGVKEAPGSAGVVQGVSEDRYAIGYSGIGYLTSGVKALKLREKDGGTAYEPTHANVVADVYPLGRYLNVYVNKAPGRPLAPLTREFLRFVFTREGQEGVVKAGFMSLDAKAAAKERAKFE